MSQNTPASIARDFLINKALRSDTSLAYTELNLLRALIRAKLAELAVQAESLDVKTSTAEDYNNLTLTAISLKCIFWLANRIEKETGYF